MKLTAKLDNDVCRQWTY